MGGPCRTRAERRGDARMGYKVYTVDRVVAVHFAAEPKPEDILDLARELPLLRQRLGRPMILLSYAPPDAPAADTRTRALIRNHGTQFLSWVDQAYVIV